MGCNETSFHPVTMYQTGSDILTHAYRIFVAFSIYHYQFFCIDVRISSCYTCTWMNPVLFFSFGPDIPRPRKRLTELLVKTAE